MHDDALMRDLAEKLGEDGAKIVASYFKAAGRRERDKELRGLLTKWCEENPEVAWGYLAVMQRLQWET